VNTSSATIVASGRIAKLPALIAVALGLLVVFAAGFANSAALHNATHDTRHAFGLPCH
jgi:cobalt transporter subunit CbtB